MNKLNQLTKFFILSILLTSSCGFKRNSFENYKETINETLNTATSNLKEIQNIADVKDMRGCSMSIQLGIWNKDKIYNKRKDRGIWTRSSSSYDHGIIGSGNETLDFSKDLSTTHLTQNPLIHIVYIGPWHYSKKVEKEIRFVVHTGKGGGAIFKQFESKNSENALIPQKAFDLNPKIHNMKDRTGVCITKWIANHVYNAISKVKSKNPFSRNYMVPTGEIIQVED